MGDTDVALGIVFRTSGYVPNTQDPITVPSFEVAAAAIVLIAAWAFEGLVKPGMVNLISAFAGKVSDAIAPKAAIKTKGPVPIRVAVPDGVPIVGAVNMRTELPEFSRLMFAPMSVMMILPLLGTADEGVKVTLILTPEVALKTLLRVMAGQFRLYKLTAFDQVFTAMTYK